MNKSQFLLASPQSSSGKTTLTIALLKAFKKKGKVVQPYKYGPDYIDTQHHKYACKKNSINLDLFMSSPAYVKECYYSYLQNADIGITEGVMGLYDGPKGPSQSSAEMAKLLNLPVILVINASKVTYSVAPLIYGFKNYDTDLPLKGVIFNNVNKKTHYNILKEACEEVGVECLGYFSFDEKNEIPSRHLGLNLGEDLKLDKIYNSLAKQVSKTIDTERLLEITQSSIKTVEEPFFIKNSTHKASFNISVAYDEAFNFIYWENIRALSDIGSVTFFSPIKDKQLPKTDFLYIGGGYPELYLLYLRANTQMRESIKNYCEEGGTTYAECGGLMYLGKDIIDEEGDMYSMVNFMDIETSMLHAKLHMGYRIFNYQDIQIKGHEFHYSNYKVLSNDLESLGQIQNANNENLPVKMYRKKNTFGSYMHLYWAENPQILNFFLQNKKQVI